MEAEPIFKPGSKAAWVMEQGMDRPYAEVLEAAKKAGIKMTVGHVQQIRSSYKRKLRDREAKRGRKNGHAHAPADGKTSAAELEGQLALPREGEDEAQGGRRKRRSREELDALSESEAEAALSAMDRQFIRLAIEVGFGRAAVLLERYRRKLSETL